MLMISPPLAMAFAGFCLRPQAHPSPLPEKLTKFQAVALLKDIISVYETSPRSGPRDLQAVKSAIRFADINDARVMFRALRDYHGWLVKTYSDDAGSLDSAMKGIIFGLRYKSPEPFPAPLHFDEDGYLRLPPFEFTFLGVPNDFDEMLLNAENSHRDRRDLSDFRATVAKEEQRINGSLTSNLSHCDKPAVRARNSEEESTTVQFKTIESSANRTGSRTRQCWIPVGLVDLPGSATLERSTILFVPAPVAAIDPVWDGNNHPRIRS